MLAARTHLLVQVLSNYSFIEPATLAFAFAGAHGVDSYLRASHPAHPLAAPRVCSLGCVWSLSHLVLYRFWYGQSQSSDGGAYSRPASSSGSSLWDCL